LQPNLTDAQLAQLRTKHNLVVPRFWDGATCDAVTRILERRCTPEHSWEFFPHAPEDELLWRLFCRPPLLDAAERYLETADFLLCGSQFQGRWQGDHLDDDQHWHLDQSNNTLLVEPLDGRYKYLSVLNYWTDVDAGCGPTALLEGERETPLVVERGTALFYNLNTTHRGTRMTRPGARRFVSWFLYRPSSAPWSGQMWYANLAERPGMVQFLEQASPRERGLLGVPPPGHPYWTEDTMARVQARYPGWDMAPYRQTLH
jgi:hypothetical protein